MKWNLRNRLLIPVLGLIVVGMGTLTGASYYNSKTDLEEAITGRITQLADSTQNVLATWERDRRLDIRSWAESNVYKTAVKDSFVGKAAVKTANQTLGELKEQYGYYENICLSNEQGALVAAADPGVVGTVEVADRPYFATSMKGKLFISDVMKSRDTGNPVFVISAPVQEKGHVVGVLFGVVDVNTFSARFVDPIKVGESGYAYIYDRDGKVIAHPNKEMILSLNMKEFDFGREMMAQGSGQVIYTYEGVEKVVAFRKLEGMDWTVGVGASTDELFAPVRAQARWNGILAGAVILAAVVLLLLLIRSVVGPLNRIVAGLFEGADQVAIASGQISSSSQTLAEGASEQAASIEETSSSLEEMSSMTGQNADNAQQAQSMMKEAGQIVERANGNLTEMIASISDITEKSNETGKIIKTIDEIAFQTNLLALNAAVEAARAGEAGAGFAVVADEVRNLAMRAAEAAKNTSALIEATIAAVQTGNDLTRKTQEAFAANTEIAMKIGGIIDDIAAASREQSEGIDQVNVAVADMDKVTQQNAANAEESASSAEEMSAQAARMRGLVEDLVSIVDGEELSPEADGAGRTGHTDPKAIGRSTGALQSGHPGRGRHHPVRAGSRNREVPPEQAIPLKEHVSPDI